MLKELLDSTDGYSNCNEHTSLDDFFGIQSPRIDASLRNGWETANGKNVCQCGWF